MKKLFLIVLILLTITIILSFIISNYGVNYIAQNTSIASNKSGYLAITMSENGVEKLLDVEITKIKTFVFLVAMLVINLPFIGFYIFATVASLNIFLSNRRVNSKTLIYQRDLPLEYNSAIASYLFDNVIEIKKDYTAILIELEAKNFIQLIDKKYIVNEATYKTSTNKLLNSEKYVLTALKDNIEINYKTLKMQILDDAQKIGLIEPNYILIMLTFIFMFLIFNIFGIVILIFLFQSATFKESIMKLTAKGKIEKEKMIKLKTFIKNFSTISEIENISHNIWGRYLAFSTAFKLNKKITTP